MSEKKLVSVGLEAIQFCSQGMMIRVNEDLYVLVEDAERGITPPDDELDSWLDDDGVLKEDEYAVVDYEEDGKEWDTAAMDEMALDVKDEDASIQAQEAVRKFQEKNATDKVKKMVSDKGD